MANVRSSVLIMYRKMLRESGKFTSYNYRMYALRRIKDAFHANKSESNSETIAALLKQAQTSFEIIQRQASLSQMYREQLLVVEGIKKSQHQQPSSPSS